MTLQWVTGNVQGRNVITLVGFNVSERMVGVDTMHHWNTTSEGVISKGGYSQVEGRVTGVESGSTHEKQNMYAKGDKSNCITVEAPTKVQKIKIENPGNDDRRTWNQSTSMTVLLSQCRTVEGGSIYPTEIMTHGRSIPQDIFNSLAGEKTRYFEIDQGTSGEKGSHCCPCLIAPTGKIFHKEDRWRWAIGRGYCHSHCVRQHQLDFGYPVYSLVTTE